MYEYCQYTDTNDFLYPEILVHTLRIKAHCMAFETLTLEIVTLNAA